jgi:hypothetical protein
MRTKLGPLKQVSEALSQAIHLVNCLALSIRRIRVDARGTYRRKADEF